MEQTTNLQLGMKQINNLCTGVKLAVELKSEEDNLRKFLTVQGYRYNADGQVIRLEKVLNKPDFLDTIYFEVRCYELSVDFYTNHWDVTEDDLASEVYLDDIKGVKELEKVLSDYIQDYSVLRPEWECDNLL
ncbi:MAG: hypothetical protein K2N85_10565 [Lachnospiraceae bacterium]|nr:hypothetical protein [Lachnospiraceae bacterium]